uniref:Queuine tRNA-ribosyltransferase catalytic subunit 1-like isoform X1 n=2 Tax=Cicer arietinum TaxID=3827 RepID=A0A3Q7XTU6_CICAR|nr:queuine tRNA-ribosyltransferase catalytic subunit 1-like isoform X1 [Cicer arietinum]
MALDDVIKTTVTGPRVEEAMYRTLRWIDRCIEAHKRPHDQNLFGIVQGGLDPRLRDICVQGLVERNLPGSCKRLLISNMAEVSSIFQYVSLAALQISVEVL